MAEEAKQQAVQDIKEDLERHHRCFIAFLVELDPIMEQLVQQQSKEQLKLSKI